MDLKVVAKFRGWLLPDSRPAWAGAANRPHGQDLPCGLQKGGDMEAWLLERLAEILAVNAEVEGMKAENMQRQLLGDSMAFGEKHFREKADYLFSIAALINKSK
jgi:hypothetical protein